LPGAEVTPPLSYVLAWPWAHVFGTQEAALRSFSALLGIAVVPVAYLAGRELVSHATGLVAAALVAFNPLLVWYSQEARPYSLLVLLSGLSFLLFVAALERPSGKILGGWATASGLAFATHYFAGLVILPELAWLAYRVRP